ncbi:aminotransferase class I/II-fold pyridoxal phosphate-dependent enzyme [Teichococcus aestuarii]|uniref:aminotransferase class I/II-fold pyridoxal phosphate-dependent enzyme n=1 Tax=Teichococcus aestuarii TaxID=568898 RepID=UPI0036121388
MYDLWVNYPAIPAQEAAVSGALRGLLEGGAPLPAAYGPPQGAEAARRAIAPLLGLAPGQALALTCGGQSALSVAFTAALAAAGPGRRRIAMEAHTFPMARHFLALEGVPTLGLPMDAEGMDLAALEQALASPEPPGVLYVMPVVHNPLGLTYSAARLAALAAIVARHDLWVVEDEAYAFLAAPELRPPSLASLLPERVFGMWSLSKMVSLSLRLGAVSAPAALAEVAAEQIRIRGLTANPVIAAATARLAEDGTAARLVAEKRAEGAARRALAREILGTARFATEPGDSWHIWMHRPAGEAEADFLARARAAEVSLAPATPFRHAGGEAPFFRLSLGGEAERARLAEGLGRLARVLT